MKSWDQASNNWQNHKQEPTKKEVVRLDREKKERQAAINADVTALWNLQREGRFQTTKERPERGNEILEEARAIFAKYPLSQIRYHRFLNHLYDEFIICERYPLKDFDNGITNYRIYPEYDGKPTDFIAMGS